MATYCTVDDVQQWLTAGLTITDASTPSISAVQSMIVNVGDEIDALLDSRGYALPIDPETTDAALKRVLSILETANLYGALARFYKVKYASGESGPGSDKGAFKAWNDMWLQIRNDIETLKMGLADPREDDISGFDDDTDPWVERESVF